jgi:tetratricopeptide (TPR) repeat protein
VALLQQVPADSFPELGGALLLLARGDSARAAEALRLAAGRLATGEDGEGSGGGRPDLLLLAGRVAARLDTLQQRTALALFNEVVRTAGQGAPAPAAELEWARLLERRGQTAEAIQHLEHLILTYPGSAVVPEARRELERARGAIPKS